MSNASFRRERWAGLSGLSVVFALGGALLAFLLTRPFFDWREDQFNSWRGIYVELAFFAFLPLVAGASAWFLRSMPSFLLIAASAALVAAMVAGDRHSAPLRYDNADSLVLAAFVYTAVTLLAVGLLLPMVLVLASLWRERRLFRQ
mgnify:CR=1 FL=1